ncbi:hypothetical protein L2E82_29832 [Cichorium intybus]|uniref:Uncharacterized protein n=1 Tax=Cichorium intybus TaxID=13427 RepID=A0ACB9CZ28_CICIN|nr:hypothetical protein L2E82_29832 [Cichorium intybus]
MSIFLKWDARLKKKAIALCSKNFGLPRNPVLEKFLEPPPPPAVAKGKMAVYVGQKDRDFKRVLVKSIYSNTDGEYKTQQIGIKPATTDAS